VTPNGIEVEARTPYKLILTVGFPRSGKSSWARESGFPVVSPDAIRQALHGRHFEMRAERMIWCLAHYMVESLFLAGNRTLVLDATNITRRRRDEWNDPMWLTYFKVFNATSEECRSRALAEDKGYLGKVIENMARDFEALTLDEAGRMWE
jgi:predicted kinase